MANRASSLSRFFALCAVAVSAGCPPSQPPAPPNQDATEATATPAPPAATAPIKPPVPVEPMGLGTLKQPAPMKMSTQAPALYEVGAFPLRTTELRPGPEDDKHLVEIYCVGCHSTSYIAMQPPLPKTTWEAEVKKMRGSYGAVIPDPAAERIVTYLSSYYGSTR